MYKKKVVTVRRGNSKPNQDENWCILIYKLMFLSSLVKMRITVDCYIWVFFQSAGGSPIGSWNIEDLVIYYGMDPIIRKGDK